MPISFSSFPANWRQPLYWVEIDPSQAGTATQEQACLMVGQMFTSGSQAGTATPNMPIAIGSLAQAQAAFGIGSVIERMFNAFFTNNDQQLVYGLGLADPSSGATATGTITVSTAPTSAGTIDLYIAGQDVQIGVGGTDTLTTVAANIATAINAMTTLPVTATSAVGVVTVTAKFKGSLGNDVTLTDSYYGTIGGEVLPAGLTLTYSGATLTGGTSAPTMTTAIANLGDSPFEYVAMPYTDSTSFLAWDAEFGFTTTGRWGWMRELFGGVYSAIRGQFSALLSFGATVNSGVISVMSLEPLAPSPIWELCATYAAQAGIALENDPARPLQTLQLQGFLPATLNNRFSLSECNSLSYAGLATQGVTAAGVMMITRENTAYQLNSYGQPDIAYNLVTTLSTLASLLRSQKAAITTKYPRHKLADDGTPFGAGQAIVTPSVIAGELVSEYSIAEYNGLVEDMTDFKANLIVERDDTDPNRVNVLFPPALIGQLRIFAVLAQFRLLYAGETVTAAAAT